MWGGGTCGVGRPWCRWGAVDPVLVAQAVVEVFVDECHVCHVCHTLSVWGVEVVAAAGLLLPLSLVLILLLFRPWGCWTLVARVSRAL